jgi:Arc/MetJ-type ribon-helix-helix transcriptional regulator
MPKTVAGKNTVLISVHLPRQMVEELDELVRSGSFPSRSEAIRVAIRDLLIRERGGR